MIHSYWFAMPRTVVASQLVRPRTEITENTRPYASLPAAFQRARATILTNPAPNLIRFRSAIAFFAPVNKNLIFSPDRSPPPWGGEGLSRNIGRSTTNHLWKLFRLCPGIGFASSSLPPLFLGAARARKRERETEKEKESERELGS